MKLIILQIKDIGSCDYAFRDYDENKFNIKDYEVKFCGEFNNIETTDELTLLESIYRSFNRITDEDVARLEKIGFTGHSLSTSDIVSIDDKEYYCCSFGWKKIEIFDF